MTKRIAAKLRASRQLIQRTGETIAIGAIMIALYVFVCLVDYMTMTITIVRHVFVRLMNCMTIPTRQMAKLCRECPSFLARVVRIACLLFVRTDKPLAPVMCHDDSHHSEPEELRAAI